MPAPKGYCDAPEVALRAHFQCHRSVQTVFVQSGISVEERHLISHGGSGSRPEGLECDREPELGAQNSTRADDTNFGRLRSHQIEK